MKCGFWDLSNVLLVLITYDIKPLESGEDEAAVEL
jgi:hypothetical protein